MSRYSSSRAHLRVRKATMSLRPWRNSDRLRQRLSSVYARDTASGSREFQASSALRAFRAAVSAVKGGSGGRGAMAVAPYGESLCYAFFMGNLHLPPGVGTDLNCSP